MHYGPYSLLTLIGLVLGLSGPELGLAGLDLGLAVSELGWTWSWLHGPTPGLGPGLSYLAGPDWPGHGWTSAPFHK